MEMESPRRSRGSTHDSSPEFEFWIVGNHPELQLGNQHTADELFVDGVLLPLHLLSFSNPESQPLPPPTLLPSERLQEPKREPEQASSSITAAPITSSKRWKDIFKVGDKKPTEEKEKDKTSKKERKGSSGGGSGAELNINIWPFSRSRSAGNGGGRPKAAASAAAAAMSKSSSAPCSRSNSRGEKRWAASPGRAGGVHVGRASPVWQLRRGVRPGESKAGPGKKTGGAGGVRGLNLAPLNGCIGYRGHASCRGDEHEGEEGAGGSGGAANGSLFRFRGLFAKKVY